MPDLTCYKLRPSPDGPVATFLDAVDSRKRESVTSYGPIELNDGKAALFVGSSSVHPPEWSDFIQAAFGTEVLIPLVGGASALLVVRIDREGAPDYLAFTFGQGRYLLGSDVFIRGFGLRTALNIIFEGDDGTEDIDPARLRSIDSKRVGEHVLRSRHQVPGMATLEGLAVNARRDLLRGVTGTPQNQAVWWTRITGSDPLVFFHNGSLVDLPASSQLILDAYDREDYKERFGFVDDARMVTDPVVQAMLEDELIGTLQAGTVDDLDLAPPELIDWERVARFQYHSERRIRQVRHEVRLSDYLATLKPPQVANLDRAKLHGYRVYALNDQGVTVREWSIWSCLYGEITYEDRTYLLEDGDFYEVSTEFMTSLDAFLNTIQQCDKVLPPWQLGSNEGDYNLSAARSSPDYLLLDRQLVKVDRHTSAIEICDVLTSDACWIHVKRRTDGSKGIGHMLWQGFVSAELLLSDPKYQKEVVKKIRRAEKARAKEEDDTSFEGRFAMLDDGAIEAGKHEVVFAIITKSKSENLKALPFFAKTAMRETVQDLELRGFRVSVKVIPTA